MFDGLSENTAARMCTNYKQSEGPCLPLLFKHFSKQLVSLPSIA